MNKNNTKVQIYERPLLDLEDDPYAKNLETRRWFVLATYFFWAYSYSNHTMNY